MNSQIVVTRRIHPDAIQQLKKVGTVKVWEEDRAIPAAVLREWLATAQACLSMLTELINEDLLSQAPHLKIVSNMAVGYDNFDVQAANRHGVMLTNTPDVLTEATAELTWALILTQARNLIPSHRQLLDGQWKNWSPNGFLGTELGGKTLGIVGLGRIGQAVARRAPAFNMRAIALESQGSRQSLDKSIPRLPLAEFLGQADIISLHIPLTVSTQGLVDASWFEAMKPQAFLVNTARGAIIDELALKSALDQGRIAGAALDVFKDEPVGKNHPLASHPRVLATPHIGSATHETRRAMALRAAANISQALGGARPRDLLNPEAIKPPPG